MYYAKEFNIMSQRVFLQKKRLITQKKETL